MYVCHSLEELIHALRRVRPADDDRAGVHRVGALRPLPVPRPGGRAADEVRPARRGSTSSSTTTCRPTLGERIVDDSLKLVPRARLRHELGRVGGPRRRAVRDRLHEPGPGHGRQLADAAVLRVGGASTWPTWRSSSRSEPRPQVVRSRMGAYVQSVAQRDDERTSGSRPVR